MTFLSKDQLSQEGNVTLSQRGRAGVELLGNVQDFSSGFVRSLARREFETTPAGAALVSEPKPTGLEQDRARVAAARKVADNLPSYRYERFLQRYVAEEVYYRGIPAVEEKRDAFESLLKQQPKRETGGRLELDASLPMPRYYEGVDWHLEPGGYDGYDLYGHLFTRVLGPYVFKYGGYAAVGNREDITSHRVDVMSQLLKESYRRIYEPGCGGFSTLAAAHKVYPKAELVGSDVSAVQLTNGHMLAEQLGVAVTFKQRDASQTGELDNSYDGVVLYALLHELPPITGKAVLEEMFRILEPGGDIVISDPPPFRAVDPFQAVVLDWDTKHRGEPFFTAVGHTDWCEVLKEIGYENVEDYALGPDFYPWVTKGRKPA
jgi:ubiquinone/menaquinone biosynthesis C-methylase UbiE